MHKKIIRRSPSGPIVDEVGPGAMIRMAEGSFTGSQTFTSAAATSVGDPTDLQVTLTDPEVPLDYRVECEFDLLSADTGTQTITTTLRASYDGGGSFAVIQTDIQTIPGGGINTLHVHSRFVLAPLPGLVAGDPSVIIDCQVLSSSATGAGLNGPARMSISEHTP